MDKIKKLFKKVFTKEIIPPPPIGVLTTIVNIGSLWVFTEIFKINENIANAVAIILSVIFAYFVNKDFVFHSEAKNKKDKLQEFTKFMSGRAVTMIIEWGGCALLFLTPMPEMVSKLIMTVIVIILNFFISKFFAFKKKKR